MKPQPARSGLGKIVARRTLISSAGEKVSILVSEPRPSAKGIWQCPFIVAGDGPAKILRGGGVDALQALQNALEGVRVAVNESGKGYRWCGELGSGIPRSIPQGYGTNFEQRVKRAIEREQARHWRQLLKARKVAIAESETQFKLHKKELDLWEAGLKKRKSHAAKWEADFKRQHQHKR